MLGQRPVGTLRGRAAGCCRWRHGLPLGRPRCGPAGETRAEIRLAATRRGWSLPGHTLSGNPTPVAPLPNVWVPRGVQHSMVPDQVVLCLTGVIP